MRVKKQEKVAWIDSVKGIGIVLVVFGHIFSGKVTQAIYLFHMPLFFFMGGYLLNVSTDRKYFLYKKSIQLLIPYLVYLTVLYVPQEVIHILRGEDTVIKGLIRPVIGGKMLFGWVSVFWFVSCFFITQQLLNYVLSRFSKAVVVRIMLACLVLAYTNQILFPKVWFTWSLNVVFLSLPVMYLGTIYRKNQLWFNSEVLAIFCFVVVVFTWFDDQNTLDMKSNYYGIPLISLTSGLILIAGLVQILKGINRSNVLLMLFAKLGAASMTIMYLHQVIQSCMKQFLNVDSQIFRFVAAVLIPLAVYNCVSRSVFGRAFFLGSVSDFERMFKTTEEEVPTLNP